MTTSVATDAPAYEPPFGAFEYFPDNLEWSTQMIRLFSYCYVRGADFSEVHSVAKSLPVGDNAAWEAGFGALAERIESDARASLAAGHTVSARDYFLRATIYHRISGQMADIGGEHEVAPGLEGSIRCFREAAALMHPAFVPVEVPYEGASLPGYLCVPEAADGAKVPAVIDFGGIDAWAEEQYFKIGAALVERGYAVLLLNGPGQGEAKTRGIHGRHDFEVAAAAAVDFIGARPGVDADRLGLIGSSLGGYFAARAAAFEPRLKATVIWGAVNGNFARVFDEAAVAGRRGSRVRQLERFLGVEGRGALIETASLFQLGPDVMRNVSAPILIMHGESDALVPPSDAQAVYDDVVHPDKTLLIYPAGTPGSAHCQLDSLGVAQRDMGDWLDDKLSG
ncbi:alpha/beta fold hydrolase [Actinomadura sp. 7K507]|uniref:alpha/beta hydrolase family protein n=1 Tax=Actinomadura sp. 7K507 TaxID=2530365 RepID=UPI00104AC836|nr:alpha/beta fold hydrolase [Actinomadura sp. 7K507]TDC94567.1 alpha/beta hydrolase [Actinomadura sp. 7K507]